MYIKQISIYLPNEAGSLAKITKFLSDRDINMRALSIADTKEFGVLRIIVEKPEETLKILKDAGFMAVITDMIAVKMADKPGSMAKVMEVLASNGISVDYTYAFPDLVGGEATLIFRVQDNEKAVKVLKEANLDVIGDEIL